MKTFYEFKYSLNFRMIAGGVMSFDDLGALRGLLVEMANNHSKILGEAAVSVSASGNESLADSLIDMKMLYVSMIEQDIMSIDAYTEKRGKA